MSLFSNRDQSGPSFKKLTISTGEHARLSPQLRIATASLEVLEGRRMLSAALDTTHKAPPQPAGTVYSFAAQPTTPSATSSHTKGVPQLSSRPGAAFTIFLDVAGFNYTGTWYADAGGDVRNPGFTPALNDASPTGTFTTAEQAQIKVIWAQVAESYSEFNVNVTTVDPAPANIAGDDNARRAFYDATPNMMHTVIGSGARAADVTADNPGGNWLPGADGVSPGIGVVTGDEVVPTHEGDHTNFMMSQDQQGAATGGVVKGLYIGGISAHENAHSFGLFHQGDYTGNGAVRVAEYSTGDDGTGPGTYVPIIGDANNKQRIAWRDGTADVAGVNQEENDIKVMLAKDTAAVASAAGRSGGADLHFIDDGIGNTLATATPLALTGSNVNFSLAKGLIVPKSESNPVRNGASNYTTDYFSFMSDGVTTIKLSATDGSEYLTAGKADEAGTLNSTLIIYSADGTVAGTSTEDATTEIDTFTGKLSAGTYYAAIGSIGGHAQVNVGKNYDPATYFNTGDFFLTGSGFSTGVTPPTTGSLSGVLFNDTNGNGIKDATDAVSGVRQVFLDANGNGVLDSGETSTMSDAAGKYTFANVAAGTAKVTRVFPAGFHLSNPTAGTNGLDVVVTVTAGGTAVANIGTYGNVKAPTNPPTLTGTIAGTLWNDTDANGIFDPTVEAGTGARTVFVDTNLNGVLDAGELSTQSDSHGHYNFTTMPMGTFAISRVFPHGHVLSNPSAGSTNGKDVFVTLTGTGTVLAILGSRIGFTGMQ